MAHLARLLTGVLRGVLKILLRRSALSKYHMVSRYSVNTISVTPARKVQPNLRRFSETL